LLYALLFVTLFAFVTLTYVTFGCVVRCSICSVVVHTFVVLFTVLRLFVYVPDVCVHVFCVLRLLRSTLCVAVALLDCCFPRLFCCCLRCVTFSFVTPSLRCSTVLRWTFVCWLRLPRLIHVVVFRFVRCSFPDLLPAHVYVRSLRLIDFVVLFLFIRLFVVAFVTFVVFCTFFVDFTVFVSRFDFVTLFRFVPFVVGCCSLFSLVSLPTIFVKCRITYTC